MYHDRSVYIVQEPEQPSPMSAHFDVDLCQLLQTMNLSEKQQSAGAYGVSSIPVKHTEDQLMDSDPHYHSDARSDCSESSANTGPAETYYGCAYLQAIQSQIDNYPTTGGEYVEAIFTHREIFAAHPVAHRDCARGFSDIASVLEKRAWRADREADVEAVSAFRHEAWMVANSL
ncbi:hypothetical protein CC1G_14158 [Coprinopsis cinerea okayama7|uniref:Uncharacterized protein n=1 Tax=Coprinopsis cinerea (strain Okayama-7 / 130 / ATCC MYA-4618 / FGSC 9003) TaxID=240176 RepID=D6RLL9_COPC7|nr:hypothetical protein CC1G_14158 [Coprinopsis cinerea okayama7\|eukprot:XP_002911625.1 hypothetical protein CC1G_14158 [Coprinopsis cinerea okayama7\